MRRGFVFTATMDYKYIIDYLTSTVGPTIQDIGDHDSRVSKYTEMVIAEAFRRYMCGEVGDKGNAFFKADRSGRRMSITASFSRT